MEKTFNVFMRDDGSVLTDFGETRLREGESPQEAARRRYNGWQAGWHYEGCVTPYHWLGAEAENV